MMSLEALRVALLGVSAYRNVLGSPLVSGLEALLAAICAGRGEEALSRYAQAFYHMRREGWEGPGDALEDMLLYEEAPYPLLAERGGADPALETAARRDIETFALLSRMDCDKLIDRMRQLLGPDLIPVLSNLPRWKAGAPFSFESLTESYHERGAGLFARHRAFLWEGGSLRSVGDPDCMEGGLLIGYERQRRQVEANTRALLEGSQVNNVLLYGDPGTGKSVTVKSLLAVPGFGDLRLIEVQKEELVDLPGLIRMLEGRRQKFILFIDDLAFDQDDRTYSVLKTILEGGLERRPANVAVYATSNRRHLVRQTFSDRVGDEVDRTETIAEKTSLSERFGLRIPYLALNKAEFLETVDRMAEQYGVAMDKEELHAGAVKFEVRHPGKTPRTARQYIASLGI